MTMFDPMHGDLLAKIFPAEREPEAQRKFLRTKKAAAFLDVSPDFLRALRTRGDGPPFARLGSIVLYDQRDLTRWVDSRKTKPTTTTKKSPTRRRAGGAERLHDEQDYQCHGQGSRASG